MAIKHIQQSPEGFADFLRSHLVKNGYDVMDDHYEGWFIGNFFSIGYISRNAVGSKYRPIRNRMLGYISKEGEGAKVSWFRFQGFTDPICLLSVLIFTFIFLVLVRRMGGIIQGSNNVLLQYSIIFTLLAAVFSCTFTKGSKEGALGYQRLKDLIYPELAVEEEKPQDDDFFQF